MDEWVQAICDKIKNEKPSSIEIYRKDSEVVLRFFVVVASSKNKKIINSCETFDPSSDVICFSLNEAASVINAKSSKGWTINPMRISTPSDANSTPAATLIKSIEPYIAQ